MGGTREKIRASSAAKFDTFVEKQLSALQLQSLQGCEVSQQGYDGSPHYYYYDYKMRQSTYLEALPAPMPRPNFPLPSWKGKVVSMAMDPCNCKYLQTKIEEGNPVYVELILSEVKDSLYMLMTDPIGNDLIKKIFEARRSITWQQMDFVVYLIISNDQKLKDVCMDNHGTWVMQVMLENITSPFMKVVVVYTIKRITAALMKNFNGSHVIVQCVKLFPPELQKIIMEEVARNCIDIATDKVGFEEIIKSPNILNVLQNPYGNFVAQRALEYTQGHLHRKLSQLIRSYHTELHSHPYGKNVLIRAMANI
ncbi:pumilio domain-containing protein [Trifolium pratense]|uniref:Pumilio domain-containing protein n=1 Tax=Trifolium pratense TaxID=57577 RepID=A0A2K3NM83_TRIPR|nr:pumilio domain-containing protein [Trifolium pratense]